MPRMYGAIWKSSCAEAAQDGNRWPIDRMKTFWKKHVARTIVAQKTWYAQLIMDGCIRGEPIDSMRYKFEEGGRVPFLIQKLQDLAAFSCVDEPALGSNCRYEFFGNSVAYHDWFHSRDTISGELDYFRFRDPG